MRSSIPQIVYEDQELLVIDKPCNLHSVKNPKSNAASLEDWLIENLTEISRQDGKLKDAGLVQRLDFETCGLMIVAKNPEIWLLLHEMILKGAVRKEYHCLVEGQVQLEDQWIDNYIGSPYRRAKKVKVYKTLPKKSDRALSAKTRFCKIKSSYNRQSTLLKAEAHSARRHQIRAHSAFIGHPLVGDALYGSKTSMDSFYPAQFFLQASALDFKNPFNQKRIFLKLEIPFQIEEWLSG